MKNFYLLAALLLVTACKSDPKPVENNGPQRLQEQVDSLVATVVKENEPGAAILISYNGEKVVSKGYGLRNLETGEPITSSTNMRMGSVSKQFTALAVLALIEEGKLKLQDSIYNIYPFEGFKGVTIEQLLHHTSGLADAEEVFLNDLDTTRIAINQDVVDFYEEDPDRKFAPGTQWSYNNGTYELLAAIVEKISGQTFASYAREKVFKKAGMKNTQFFNLADPTDILERAVAYVKDSTGNWVSYDDFPLNGLLGAGGVYTNLEDLHAYLQNLRSKNILSRESHILIFEPDSIPIPIENTDIKFLEVQTAHYAKGWEVAGDIALHGGGWFGVHTFVIHHRKKPLDIAIFMNSERLFQSNLIDKVYALVLDYVEELEKSELKVAGSNG